MRRHVLSLVPFLATVALLGACDGSSTDSGSRDPAQISVVSGDAQQATAGAQLPNPLVVRVTDAQGRAVAGQLVTGARPNGYQENRGFSLPNSHLPVSYSIELYKFSETDTPGILPDQRIEPDWKSFLAGRDPALEWILAYPNVKR